VIIAGLQIDVDKTTAWKQDVPRPPIGEPMVNVVAACSNATPLPPCGCLEAHLMGCRNGEELLYWRRFDSILKGASTPFS
jgi:hypothetical protein